MQEFWEGQCFQLITFNWQRARKTSLEVDIRGLNELTALVCGCSDRWRDAAEQVQVSLRNVFADRV